MNFRFAHSCGLLNEFMRVCLIFTFMKSTSNLPSAL